MARFNRMCEQIGGRTLVAVLLVFTASVFACTRPEGKGPDLLIFASGATQEGELKTCDGDDCVLDKSSVTRNQIAWIGLSQPVASPPAVQNPGADEVHTRNGAVASAGLLSISARNVVTEKRSYDRTEVAWIHLAATTKAGVAASSAASSAVPGTRFFHYDVKVIVHAQSFTTTTGVREASHNGEDVSTIDWTSTFTDVILKKVTHDDGTVEMSLTDENGRPVQSARAGKTDATYTLDYSSPYRGGPCKKTAAVLDIVSEVSLDGMRSPGQSIFGFATASGAGYQQMDKGVAQMNDAWTACNGGGSSFQVEPVRTGNPGVSNNPLVAVVDGLRIGYDPERLIVITEREYPADAPMLWPFKDVAAGGPFSFSTGEVKTAWPNACDPGSCITTEIADIKVNVTPHR